MAKETMTRGMNASDLRDWEVKTGKFHTKRIDRENDRIAEIGEQHEEARERVVR